MKDYVAKTKHQPNIVRFGDFNLLIFIAEAIDPEMAASVGRAVAEEEEVGEEFWQQVGSALQQVTIWFFLFLQYLFNAVFNKSLNRFAYSALKM